MLKIYICEDMEAERDKMQKVIENIVLMEDLDLNSRKSQRNTRCWNLFSGYCSGGRYDRFDAGTRN